MGDRAIEYVRPTTAPVVAGNVVAVGAGTSVAALQAGTGEVLWRFDVGSPVATREERNGNPLGGLAVAERTLVAAADDRVAAFS